jgi:threonine synthase
MNPDTASARFSYISHLECSMCARSFFADRLQTICLDCQAPLLTRYDLDQVKVNLVRDGVSGRSRGIWRWHELLPVTTPAYILTLGEGDTPHLHLARLGAEMGLSQLYLKDESLNPTGTFKARGLALAVARARELGVRQVIIPTAGNAGGALAAYAARAGLAAHIIMPRDTPVANVEECRITGAQVTLVDGLISDAGKLAGELAISEGWFDVSTFKEPYRLEGKKTMGYEIAEAFGWRLPDVILYPTGGGMGLVAIWKAFNELEQLGWLEDRKRPRLVAVQAEGCAPVVRAVSEAAEACETWHGAQTIASGLRVPKSFGDRLLLRAIYDSQGTAITVTDQEIQAAQAILGRLEGIFAAPEGAANLAALYKLKSRAWVDAAERILLLNTGTGLKYV